MRHWLWVNRFRGEGGDLGARLTLVAGSIHVSWLRRTSIAAMTFLTSSSAFTFASTGK
jgi:hypothetical protein